MSFQMQLEKIAKMKVAVWFLRIQDLKFFNLPSTTIQYITETVRYRTKSGKKQNLPDLFFLKPWHINSQLGQNQC